MFRSNRKSGFTLVELSIVLVIIGLIVGGVLAGQTLIKAAELRKIISERETYQSAVNAFRAKYNAIPGDMKNATQFWGRADNGAFSGQCAAPQSNTGSGKQTCNGNGSKNIGDISQSGIPYEMYRFWQHLANAELIGGQYTGTISVFQPGVDVGRSTLSGIYWHVFMSGNSLNTWMPKMTFDLPIMTGDFIAADVKQIDEKADNGLPMTGRIVVGNQSACTDSGGDFTSKTAVYLISNNNTECVAVFNKGF